jgi:hypothetical protein
MGHGAWGMGHGALGICRGGFTHNIWDTRKKINKPAPPAPVGLLGMGHGAWGIGYL